ncbi:hypothetical protein LTR56_023712 [Elasticomyces elasticus]|nr:hypothetical protein LTR22_026605 [Elasticomyces elasticus]KAK3619961.1 hypothetical protein LTR56_023712 [Elasticomyces elasticus]
MEPHRLATHKCQLPHQPIKRKTYSLCRASSFPWYGESGYIESTRPSVHVRVLLPYARIESLVDELESKGEALWTREHGPTAIAGYCSPPSIRKLAALDDDRLNDEIVNTIPIIAIPADTRTYLLPSYAFEHIRKGRFDRLSPWVKCFPSVNCRWVLGVCQQDHWTAVAINWKEGTIQHYNPLTGLPKQAGDIYTTISLRELKLHPGG